MKLASTVCAGILESDSCTVKAELPACEGVPVIAPEEEFRVSPAGKDPDEIDQL